MGVYNSIYVPCPDCGNNIEFQSKSGSCQLSTYSISDCPEKEVEGIMGDSWCCENCGADVVIAKKEERSKDFSHLVKYISKEYK